jgi:branched-chain amino acid transport system substrate-binding protein
MKRVPVVTAAVLATALALSACSKSDPKTTEAAGTAETTVAGAAAETTAAAAADSKTTEAPVATETTAAAGTDAMAAETTVAAAGGAAMSDCKLDKPLKIAYAADFDLGGIGDVPASNAAKYQIDEINKAGGVGGKPVEYVIKQISQVPADPAAAQRGVQELIDGGANIILGPPFSDYGLPILEVTKGKIPVLFVTSTEVVLTDPSRGSFLVTFNDKVQGSAAAEMALRKGFKSAVTMSSNEIPYLTTNPTAFTEVFNAGGGKVEKDLSFKLGLTDFSAQVNEIAGMKPQPDAIYSAFFMPEAGIFLKQLRAAGVKSTVMSADGFDASAVWTAGKDAEGVLFTTHTFPDGTNNKVQAFLDGYAKSGGKAIETAAFGALGGDAAIVATEAVKKACSTDGATLIKTIGELKVDGISGTIDYAGTNGTPKRDVTILTVTDGKPAKADAFYPKNIAK